MTSDFDFLPLSEEPVQSADGESRIRLELDMVSVVNYALQQNRIPVIQSLSVYNDSENDIKQAHLSITSTPEILRPLSIPVDLIPGKSRRIFRTPGLTMNAEYLAGLTEKVSGTLTVALTGQEGEICEKTTEITALAYDEWQGYSCCPELLTAFVTPNHPETAKLSARAAQLLEQWTGDPSLDAYQSHDPNRVLAQAAAFYGALQEQNIVYAVAPASFEERGQRVRLCDTVISQKMGNCLELTLLYAACLEAAGLNPLLILKKGHIFAGVWLEDLSFSESVQDDASVVTKRLAEGIGELIVVECTLAAAGKGSDFDDARRAAEQEMMGIDAIECIIDVKRARLSGISPLPSRIRMEDGWYVERPETGQTELTAAPKDMAAAVSTGEAENPVQDEGAASRKNQWERKLLDLGLRNTLINMRLSGRLVPLLTSSLDELEDALSDGSDFSILPRPSDWQPPGGEPDFETMHDTAAAEELIRSEFKNRRLRSVLTESEFSKAVKELYRTSRTAIEENGANTLYLAMGLLRWYENRRSTKARYAPVILIPVEIIRRSSSQGYIIRLRDDEPQINITMLEKLRQDFQISVNGLDPLPYDEHGLDTRKIFTIIRKAVMGEARWDVLESAYLGIFSFSQFVMWNDIRNRSGDLEKNKVVKSLLDGKLAWDAEPMEIGNRVDESGVFLPIPADASQLYAIEAACGGESFVLHGPPGTGKSQTITALIANALAQGRTVLFVAEKMAALQVVQKRLESIGLGPFCLELHSNKSRKRDVLEQLRRVTEIVKEQSSGSYLSKAEQIARIRAELDLYASELHQRRRCGRTLSELIADFEEYRQAPELPSGGFDSREMMELSAEELEDMQILAERLFAAAAAVGHPSGHPLRDVGCTQYSQNIRAEMIDLLQSYRMSLSFLRDAETSFVSAAGAVASYTFDDLQKNADIAAELQEWLRLPESWAKAGDYGRYLGDVRKMASHFLKSGEMKNALCEKWQEEFLYQDAAQLLQELTDAESRWALPRAMALKKLVKKISVFAKTSVTKDSLSSHFMELSAYQREKQSADELFEKYGSELSFLYQGEDTDWQNIIEAADNAENSEKRLRDLDPSGEILRNHGGSRQMEDKIVSLRERWDQMIQSRESFCALLDIADHRQAPAWITYEIQMCDSVERACDDIKDWITWNAVCKEGRESGLEPLISAYEQGMSHEDIPRAYRKSVYRSLASGIIDSVPSLSQFSGAVFNEKIEQFRRLDAELTELTQKEIYCRLAAKVPDFTKEAAQSSELGILQKAIRSGGRGISIRKLFEQIPNLLPRLCPCMLMSPISAAQYLDPKREPFSLVVFDEASQLPTCKAVGALARGENAVIVGDPKQMPPTSFFSVNAADEDNLEAEDLESILDDCLALNMPQTHLLWHYRSRHESLIAFSNSRFYENRLFTFPSVNDRESKVRLVPVEGVFDRGRTRQNRAEAEAVIEHLKERCRDRKASNLSVGIVTFNIAQQNLIDDLMMEACREDPELEAWAYGSAEPLFIKNLENVQGDERDVILFSIGYGPDREGRIAMNFGPLNRDGGWRRLNVAITRARCEMIVFSTLRPDQINLSRTSAEGVAALKGFLQYAAEGDLPMENSAGETAYRENSGIAEEICRILSEHGYNSDRAVGHSEYRIDIGVIDPADPDEYLLGILLDGRGYGSAKTSRDRELAQISVLNGLGWDILRIWSMDWWDNSRREISRLLAILEQLKAEAQSRREELEAQAEEEARLEAEKAAAEAGEETEVPDAGDSDEGGEPETQETGVSEPEEISVPDAPEAEKTEISKPDGEIAAGEDTSEEDLVPYITEELPQEPLSAEDFLKEEYDEMICGRVQLLLDRESPISETALNKKIAQSFGFSRTTPRIQKRLSQVYEKLSVTYTVQGDQRFAWRSGQDPEEYRKIRVSGSGGERRDVRDIPVQEAAAAVCRVLADSVSLPQEALVKESARLMGYTRMGSNVAGAFAAAVEFAEEQGMIRRGAGGSWILTEFNR